MRTWGCLTVLAVVFVVVAVIVLLALIARDPTGTAGGVHHVWGQLGDGARALLYAPITFFHALMTFLDMLFH